MRMPLMLQLPAEQLLTASHRGPALTCPTEPLQNRFDRVVGSNREAFMPGEGETDFRGLPWCKGEARAVKACARFMKALAPGLRERWQDVELRENCLRLWRALVWVAVRTIRISAASATFVWEWRLYFAAALTGLAVMLVGARMVAWIQAPLSVSASGVDLSVGLTPDTRYLGNLVRQCAPGVAPNTILAIMHTESSFNPVAMHVNGNVQLQHAPKTTAEAIEWSDWLIRRGNSVDMGLMQINSHNLARLNMSVADAFEPCRNIHAAAVILTEQYKLAAHLEENSTQALLAAISAYNTGNFRDGLRNGYVSRVLQNAKNP
jgi:type IV secretion system protein VirB1